MSAAGLLTCRGSIVKVPCVCPGGIETDVGTPAAFGSVLPRAIVSPPAGAGVVSCTIPNASLSSLVPLKTRVWLRNTTPPSEYTSMVRLSTCGEALETVKLRAGDHPVTAPVFGPASPWKLRTRQYCGPAGSEDRVSRGWVSPVMHSSMPPHPPEKFGVVFISIW